MTRMSRAARCARARPVSRPAWQGAPQGQVRRFRTATASTHLERKPACKHDINEHAERPHVRKLPIVLVAQQDLGSRVCRRTARHSQLPTGQDRKAKINKSHVAPGRPRNERAERTHRRLTQLSKAGRPASDHSSRRMFSSLISRWATESTSRWRHLVNYWSMADISANAYTGTGSQTVSTEHGALDRECKYESAPTSWRTMRRTSPSGRRLFWVRCR